MGFCRRCGDIVTGQRCKCGGTAVAPAIPFGKVEQTEDRPDKWSRTYVSRDKSPTRKPTAVATHTTESTTVSDGPPSPTKRFPRPLSSSSSKTISIGNRVSTHITNATSKINRPPSPLKQSTTAVPEADILPDLYGSSLTKVYGSVLQNNEALPTHSCAICDTIFQPDATIYPDPDDASCTERFLCLSCFTANGGSKGTCPTCSRPVLAIKSQGGFVQASGKVWHKRCFNCTGCHKNIGDIPVVNLLGQPSCVDCFDSCLKRDGGTPKKSHSESVNSSPNLGGMGLSKNATPTTINRTRESSPALEELEQRLGIRSREASPALEELDRRLSSIASKDRTTPTRKATSSRYSHSSTPDRSPLVSKSTNVRALSPSPTRSEVKAQLTGSTTRYSMGGSPRPIQRNHTGSSSISPTEEAIEEMKRRFLKDSTASSGGGSVAASPSPRRVRTSRSSSSLRSSESPVRRTVDVQSPASDYELNIPPTPDLVSDFSDTTTQSSFLDSPPQSIGDRTVLDTAKVYQQGHGTKYTRGDFLEYGNNEPRTPPKLRSRTMSTPTSSPLAKVMTGSTSRPTTPTKKPSVATLVQPISPSACCAKCGGSLFTAGSAGKFVTVPSDNTDSDSKSKSYHTECFRCAICEGVFKEGGQGQAIFVRAAGGPCHIDCAPPEKYVVKSKPTTTVIPPIFSIKSMSTPTPPVISAIKSSPSTVTTKAKPSSSRVTAHPPSTAPPTIISFPRFGSSSNCPGCRKAVSPMERGVVPGPQGTRWHATCLVCGGKKESAGFFGIKRERKKDEPGCGKRLDSAAKGDGEGGVWCRECSLLLPISLRSSPQCSPTRTSAVVPNHTGASSKGIAPQYTGTTTIARQFTGLGGVNTEAALMRQLTGGGLSPTRQLSSSPTKQLGMIGGSTNRALGRPRPKSVIGFRTITEEGRTGILGRY